MGHTIQIVPTLIIINIILFFIFFTFLKVNSRLSLSLSGLHGARVFPSGLNKKKDTFKLQLTSTKFPTGDEMAKEQNASSNSMQNPDRFGKAFLQ